MNVIDYILDGLEAELALERELGVRSFECDRSLLSVQGSGRGEDAVSPIAPSPVPAALPPVRAVPPPVRADASPVRNVTPPVGEKTSAPRQSAVELAFLHEKPLSPGGVEMIAKIIAALGHTADSAPVIIEPPLPPAKTLVVLGSLALRKWFPGRKAAPGQKFTTDQGVTVTVTYSPEYILRFKVVTPAVKQIKLEMWNCLKPLKAVR